MDAPPFPTPDADSSDNPDELRHVIAALRAHAAWQTRALSATQAAHDMLAQRASDQVDDAEVEAAAQTGKKEQGEVIESLRAQLFQAREDRDEARRLLEQESSTVRDLRLRLADSRRAFMRLQQEGESVRKAIADRRRSQQQLTGSGVGAGGAGGAGVGLGLSPSILAAGQQPTPAPPDDPGEAKAKRASKRASLAFGPNGTINLTASRNFGRTGHARTPSSTTSSFAGAGNAPLSTTAPTASSSSSSSQTDRKLRGLSLLGGTATGGGRASGVTTPTIAGTSPSTNPTPRGSPPLSTSDDSTTNNGPDANPLPTKPERLHRRGSSSASAMSALSPSLRPRSPGATSTTSSNAASPRPGTSVPAPPSVADPEEAADVARRRSYMLGTGGGVASATEGNSSSVSNLIAERLQVQLSSRGAELERLRMELGRARDELDQVKEARWASDVCLQALKEYIALLPSDSPSTRPDTQMGEATTKEQAEDSAASGGSQHKRLHLPPLPVDSTAALEPGDEALALQPKMRKTHQANESWSSKLGSMWRKATAIAPSQNESFRPEGAGGGGPPLPPRAPNDTTPRSSLGSSLSSFGMAASSRAKSPPATVLEEDEKQPGTPVHASPLADPADTSPIPGDPVPPPPPRPQRPQGSSWNVEKDGSPELGEPVEPPEEEEHASSPRPLTPPAHAEISLDAEPQESRVAQEA